MSYNPVWFCLVPVLIFDSMKVNGKVLVPVTGRQLGAAMKLASEILPRIYGQDFLSRKNLG